MKRLIAVFLLAVLLITVAGCTDIDLKLEITPEQTKAAEPSQPEQPDTSIVDRLRQQMQAEDKLFAVAYLGYMSYDCESVWDFIDDCGDSVLQKLPFLKQIPETNVITSAPKGEVYCFIPTDPDAVIEIFTDASGEEALFAGSSADPFLLVCNGEYSADSYVTITDFLEGEVVTLWWYPKLDEYLFVEQLRYANGTTGLLDISPYNEMLLAYYENMQEDGEWKVPSRSDLENTTWCWDGYTQGGNYYEYRISFYEDTADVQWNHGYGETTEYKDAKWEYAENNICVLTIDFEQMAGVRKYNLLVDWDAGMMYIAADATGDALMWDMEPQYRFLMLDQPES